MVSPVEKVGQVETNRPEPEADADDDGVPPGEDVLVEVLAAEQDVAVDADSGDAPQRTHAAHEAQRPDEVAEDHAVQEPLVPREDSRDAERVHEPCKSQANRPHFACVGKPVESEWKFALFVLTFTCAIFLADPGILLFRKQNTQT